MSHRYSVIGRTRTLPTPTGNNLRARIAFFGCSNLVRALDAVHLQSEPLLVCTLHMCTASTRSSSAATMADPARPDQHVRVMLTASYAVVPFKI